MSKNKPQPPKVEIAPELGDVAVEVPPPFEDGHTIVVSYAGGEPVTYVVVDGKVEVEQKHLPEFLAVVSGAKPAP